MNSGSITAVYVEDNKRAEKGGNAFSQKKKRKRERKKQDEWIDNVHFSSRNEDYFLRFGNDF